MKNSRNVVEVIVIIISSLVIATGVIGTFYIFLGPSIGIVDAESASFGSLLFVPILFAGIVMLVLSLKRHSIAALIILTLLVLDFGFNIWQQHQISLSHPGIPTTDGGLPLSNQVALPTPINPTSGI